MFFKIVFGASVFGIFWAMVGYPLFLIFLSKVIKKENKKDYEYQPTVTVMIVAHNEEKVIKEKLENIVKLDYPSSLIKFLVASDNSSDDTNIIVREFIKENPEYDITLYEVQERRGKTNAQNEAQKLVDSEILVMTDANAMLHKDAVKELVASFVDQNIVYVTGKLSYQNVEFNSTANNEGTYWNLDLRMREIESNIQTITAGNGALYACRNTEYHDFNPIECHDISMPVYYGLKGLRCVFNKEAIAYEKAGENDEDEYKRKVRMNRTILYDMLPSLKLLNVLKYRWFSVFYIGHRTCRYSLWLFHLLVYLLNAILVLFERSNFYFVLLVMQTLFWLLVIVGRKCEMKNKIMSLIGYYGMTVVAQYHGVLNILTGKAKPIWEKAESTR